MYIICMHVTESVKTGLTCTYTHLMSHNIYNFPCELANNKTYIITVLVSLISNLHAHIGSLLIL